MLRVEGQVASATQFSQQQLSELDAEFQITDVQQQGAKRPGRAVLLRGLLAKVEVLPSATHLGLHAEADDFHASIPLPPLMDRAMIIYQQADGTDLPVAAGGPFRFWIPDHAACQADEIDECANVKFIDRIELTAGLGFDNRPKDDEEHARLHDSQ